MPSITSSIVICTRNREKDMLCFLSSLKKQTVQPDELIIVDSGDKQLMQQQVFKNIYNNNLFPKTTLLYKHTLSGLPYQRNVGVSCATGDIIYFFDDDVVLKNNYIEQMNKIFLENPQYGGGMGSIINMPRHEKKRYFLFRTAFLLQKNFASGRFTWSGMPTHVYGTNKFKKVEVLGGCCMAYRRAVFFKYMFDEKLSGYAYMEDCDFSCRVSYDFPLFYNPIAQLYHNTSPTNRLKIVTNRAMFIRNYSYLFFKNFYSRNKLKIVFYWWSILGLFLEALLRRQSDHIKGYLQGLNCFYSKNRNR